MNSTKFPNRLVGSLIFLGILYASLKNPNPCYMNIIDPNCMSYIADIIHMVIIIIAVLLGVAFGRELTSKKNNTS